jgi:hypothetical protein
MCGVYLFNGPNWQLGCVLCGTNIRIPRLSRRFRYGASTALDRCDSFDERPDLAGCLICIPSTVYSVRSGMLKKAMQWLMSCRIAGQIWQFKQATLSSMKFVPI